MTHIEFVGQSPWTLMAVSVAVAAIYYIAKKVMASNNIDEVPPRPNPPRDPFIADFNDWQRTLYKERKKLYKGRAK